MHKVVITSQPDSIIGYIQKIWRYRVLISVFAKRDLKVKYAQTFLGLGWTILQPLTALLIFTFFFGYVLNWKSENLPYPLYVLTGLLGWNFFSYIVYQGSSSIQDSGNIIKKIYFPKIILPLSKVYLAAVELLVTLLLLIPLLIWYDQTISWRIVFIPVVLFFNALIALFIVLFISALAYKRRDAFHLVPYLMNFGIWLTPVFFSKTVLPEKINFLWYCNPMASIAEAWRWCLFPQYTYDTNFLPALLVSSLLFAMGFNLYKQIENAFSDYV